MRKIKQLESLLATQCKEKMVRQTFNLEHVLKIAQRLASAGKIDDIVTDLILAFQTDEVVSIGISFQYNKYFIYLYIG